MKLTDNPVYKLYSNYKYVILAVFITSLLSAYYYLKNNTPEYLCSTQLKTTRSLSKDFSTKLINYIKSPQIFLKSINDLHLNADSEYYRNNILVNQQTANGSDFRIRLLGYDTLAGTRFIHRVIENYNQLPLIYISPAKKDMPANEDSLQFFDQKIDQAKNQLRKLFFKDSLLTKAKRPVTKKEVEGDPEVQLKLFEVYEGYLKSSVTQFTILPYADEVIDAELRNSIENFNNIQNDRQKLLNGSKITDSQSKNFKSELTSLKYDLLKKIASERSAITNSKNSPVESTEPDRILQKKSIKFIQKTILIWTAKRSKYEKMGEKENPGPVLEKINLDFKEEPHFNTFAEYPKKGITYCIAIFFSLILSSLIPFVFSRIQSSFSNKIRTYNELTAFTAIPIFRLTDLNDKNDVNFSAITNFKDALNTNFPKETPQILLTSINSSFESLPLAELFAKKIFPHSKKTVIADLNLKQGHDFTLENASSYKGVIEYISDSKTTLAELLIPYKKESGIFFIKCGSFGNEPSFVSDFFSNNDLVSPWQDENRLDQLLSSSRIASLMQELSIFSDTNIYLSASLINPPDVLPLIKYCPIQIVVVPADNLEKSQIKALNKFKNNGRIKSPIILYLDKA